MILKNSLSGKLEDFIPIDCDDVKMYVCGPTIYNSPHVGNARSLIVFDLLYRVLKHSYPKVTYVRNITDVDDKIINKAAELNISIQELTTRILDDFNADIKALNLLHPDYEPRATNHIDDMIEIIEDLLSREVAYVSNDHVLFDVSKDFYYGCLSKRKTDEMIPGKRVEIGVYKRNPLDFVLWKPAKDGEISWNSPWGKGRPGWHIECSAMSYKYLGAKFDIHGGGQDLIFPHHENEIAQSRNFHNHGLNANYWVHNGMLTIDGKKMSKSKNNAFYVKDLLQKYSGDVLKLFFFSSHYSKQCNISEEALNSAQNNANNLIDALCGIYEVRDKIENSHDESILKTVQNFNAIDEEFLDDLHHDLNTPKALTRLYEIAKMIKSEDNLSKKLEMKYILLKSLNLIGLFETEQKKSELTNSENCLEQNDSTMDCDVKISDEEVEKLIQERVLAKKEKNFSRADEIRSNLLKCGVIVEDISSTESKWTRKK